MTIFQDQGASFSPETLDVMTRAFEDAVDTLPFPVAAGRVQALARHVIDIAAQGERDAERLKERALRALAADGHEERQRTRPPFSAT